MANRIIDMRKQLHQILTEELKTPGNWDHIVNQIGMFRCVPNDKILALSVFAGEFCSGTLSIFPFVMPCLHVAGARVDVVHACVQDAGYVGFFYGMRVFVGVIALRNAVVLNAAAWAKRPAGQYVLLFHNF